MPDERRVFFALWPDDEVRRGIVRRRELLGTLSRRRVPDHNLHLTLLFLGDQPAGLVNEIQLVVDNISIDSFTLRLDRFGWFPRAGVVWLGGEAPSAAHSLASEIGRAVESLDLARDRRPFRPHVTLFRRVLRRPRLPVVEPLDWPVREFALVESIPGRPYQVLRKWSVESPREA